MINTGDTMNCKNCNKSLSKGEAICEKCGAENKPLICPNDKQSKNIKLTNGKYKCLECGYVFD